jgi:gamma-glutamyltranspeptidase/glutathione hydrolase
VASGHSLASAAGDRILASGGTAIDAGIAAGVCLNVLLFDQVNYGGVAPIALFHAESQQAAMIDGDGVWPRRASRRSLARAGGGKLPEGILRTVTPAAPDAWLTALQRFGTLTVGEVFEPAWELASTGAPLCEGVAAALKRYSEDPTGLAPTTLASFFPGGRVLKTGEIFARPELASVLKAQMDEEARARREGLDRQEAIRRARDLFYKGWIAEEIVKFQRVHGGLLDAKDMASYAVEVSQPLRVSYRERVDVLVGGPWCQGPVLLQSLKLLETFDLADMNHNSSQYLHLMIEVIDRSFSDREYYYGDPRFVDVPLERLLSGGYASERAAGVDLERASGRMPTPGDAIGDGPIARLVEQDLVLMSGMARSVARGDIASWPGDFTAILEPPKIDTSFAGAVDADGNMFAATPSDPVFLDTPVIPTLGFSLSGRGSQSRLDEIHPNRMEPGKRPRMTPSPALVMKDGSPLMAMGCPGGDAQPQALLQVLANLVDFEMDPQQAVEAPRITSWNFPNSFAPHEYYAARVDAESRIPHETLQALAAMGHRVCIADAWSAWAGTVYLAIRGTASLAAAVDPREDGAAVGW